MEWICVHERLPKYNDMVMTYDGVKIEMVDADFIGLSITHWMPLPQKPKDKNGMD